MNSWEGGVNLEIYFGYHLHTQVSFTLFWQRWLLQFYLYKMVTLHLGQGYQILCDDDTICKVWLDSIIYM